jgi:heat shock protein HslJ
MNGIKWYEILGLAVIVGLTVFAGLSCSKADAAGDLGGVTWVLQSYGDPASLTPIVAGSETTAIFHPEWKEVRGSGGVNGYGGDYLAEGNKLSVSGIIHTEMASTNQALNVQESEFFKILSSSQSFKIKDKQLTITGREGTLVLLQK